MAPVAAIAIDGKEVRGAKNGGGTKVHLLAGIDHTTEAVLVKVNVSERHNEITYFKRLLEGIKDQAGVVICRRRQSRATLSRRGVAWALEGIVVQHLTVARVAEGLGVSWNTANNSVLAEGKLVLIDEPECLEEALGSTCGSIVSLETRCPRRGDIHCPRCSDVTHRNDPQVLPKASSIQ